MTIKNTFLFRFTMSVKLQKIYQFKKEIILKKN